MINVKLNYKHLGTAATLSLIVLALLSSCDHKELCFDHEEHAPKYQLHVDATYQQEWEIYNGEGIVWKEFPTWIDSYGMAYDDLKPKIPAGLRMHDFPVAGQYNMTNMPAFGESVRMRPGEHQLLFYNNDTEYIVFNDMYSYASAKATTRTRSRSTYIGNPFRKNNEEKEPTLNMPDMLYGNYISSYTAELSNDEVMLPVIMHPLVFKYLVRYEFSKGLEYVGMGRGALSGMASSVYLHSGRTSKEASTVLFDCTIESWGIQAIVATFGVPDYPNTNYSPTRSSVSHALNLEVRLKNGVIKEFNFDVSEQIEKQPQGGVIVVRDVEIQDNEGTQGGSGFDVSIEGWGDFQDVVIPMK